MSLWVAHTVLGVYDMFRVNKFIYISFRVVTRFL